VEAAAAAAWRTFGLMELPANPPPPPPAGPANLRTTPTDLT